MEIKHQSNTTVVRHFASHQNSVDLRMTIYILEYIRTLMDVPRSYSFGNERELVWIYRPHTMIHNSLNIMDWD